MSTIENGITYSKFRRRCEDKNTLTCKGSLYIGTGEIDKEVYTGEMEDKVYKTEELPPPSESERKFLVSDASGNTRWDDLYKIMTASAYNEATKEPNVMYFVYPDEEGV